MLSRSQFYPFDPSILPTPLLTANHGVPAYESATSHAQYVRKIETTNSFHRKALMLPAAILGTQTSSVSSPICKVTRTAASRAHTPVIMARPAAIKPPPVKYDQNTGHCIHAGTSGAVASR